MMDNTAVSKYERKVTPAERLFTRSPFSVVTMIARINGNVSEEMLRNAVSKARQRHVLLNVRIKEDDDHGLWFTSDGVGEIPVGIVPRQSADDWIRIHGEASKIPFEFESRPAIRFILVQSPAVSELIILCHHIICDGLSLAYLARDLLVLMGDPAAEVDLLPPAPPITLDNLPAGISQSGLRKYFINRINRQWAADSVYFDAEDYEALTKAYWDNFRHQLLSIELSEEQTAALVARCKEEGVTVTTALAAAISGAQRDVQGEKPYHARTVIATSLRDRLPNSPGQGMGFYAAGIELKLKYDRQKGFWENARQFHKKIRPNFNDRKVFGQFVDWLYLDPTYLEAMNFKKLGGLVAPGAPRHEKLAAFSQKEDAVLSLIKRDRMESLERILIGPAITNLGRMDIPRRYGALELDRLIMQPGGAFPLVHVNMVLGAVTCSGKVSLVIEYAEEAIGTPTMEKIRDTAMGFLG